MTALRVSKTALRKEIKTKISEISFDEKKKQSKIVAEKLRNLPIFKESKRVSIFLSIESEINTKPIVCSIFEDGKQCFVPRYTKTSMEMVKLHSMNDWDSLPLTKWHIKQPALNEDRESAVETGGLDLIIVPGVAFTKDGSRLGHGGGYYDKFLQNLKSSQKTPLVTVALAFKEQIVEQIPVDVNDVAVDFVLYAD